MNNTLQSIEAVRVLLQKHDHFDVKRIEGAVTLRQFIAGALTYHPLWLKGLYAIRAGFVRVLGMKQQAMAAPRLTAETVPSAAGEWATFFRVVEAQEDCYWIATAGDKHLDSYLMVVAEPRSGGVTRFDVGTLVRYHNWAGPLYFNVIRPFHHVVVWQMMKAGVRSHQPVGWDGDTGHR
jgi:hypothetical protein